MQRQGHPYKLLFAGGGWSPKWMWIVDMNMATWRTPMQWQGLPPSPKTDTDCICRKYQLQLSWLQPSTATYTDLLPRLANPPPHSGVYNKPDPWSVICNQCSELSGCYCISIRAHCPADLSFSVCVCHFFIHYFPLPKSGQSKCHAGCCRREKCKLAHWWKMVQRFL